MFRVFNFVIFEIDNPTVLQHVVDIICKTLAQEVPLLSMTFTFKDASDQ